MSKRPQSRTFKKSANRRQRTARRLAKPNKSESAPREKAQNPVTSQQPNSTFSLTYQRQTEHPETPQKFQQTLTLYRYPRARQHVSLQAWDSADEYLLATFIAKFDTPENSTSDSSNLSQVTAHILILNDEFGALACAVKTILPNAQISWQSDSFIAQQALFQNAKLNNIVNDKGGIASTSIYNSLVKVSDLPSQPDFVLLKLPRAHALLEEQLTQLQLLPASTHIIAAGKVKAVQSSVLELFNKYLDNTHTSLAVKKSRLIFANPKEANLPKLTSPYPTSWEISNPDFTLFNHANVFSRGQLDIGARFFLEHLPDTGDKTVIDLGCGNGILGLTLLKKAAPKALHFVDESHMAVASAQLNVQHNHPEHIQHCTFNSSNCLETLPNIRADIVVCNPPFHQQNTITDHVAWQMFQDAKNALITGGELRIVANRHLGHHDKLKRLFGGYQVVASNQKFSILSAIKK